MIHLVIAGFTPPTASAPLGVPVGIELLGTAGQDESLLDMAEILERILDARRVPDLSRITKVSIGEV